MMAERILPRPVSQPEQQASCSNQAMTKPTALRLANSRGMGPDEGLAILSKIREEFGCPVITDVHKRTDSVRLPPKPSM